MDGIQQINEKIESLYAKMEFIDKARFKKTEAYDKDMNQMDVESWALYDNIVRLDCEKIDILAKIDVQYKELAFVKYPFHNPSAP